MIAQFKQDLHNKNFSLQDQSKDDESDTRQKRIKFWPNNISVVESIPDNLFKYDYNDEGLYESFRGSNLFPGIRGLEEL